MERSSLSRTRTPIRRGLFALALVSTPIAGVIEVTNQTESHNAKSIDSVYNYKDLSYEYTQSQTDNIDNEKSAAAHARFEYAAFIALHDALLAKAKKVVTTPASTSTSSTTSTTIEHIAATPTPNPTALAQSPNTSQTSQNDATNAFTADWYRCVIDPESSGNFNDTSGGYGILVSTWHYYGMSGVPGEYSPATQAAIALKIYAANGGFGPGAWNNTAHCSKNG
ncbi:MAG TPA: hypothetical protein VFN56_00810 [Candidatus Saccharimonadales bacterium]|nr:hypothetical protein [Candidatus Saccharimonadales bacterium]